MSYIVKGCEWMNGKRKNLSLNIVMAVCIVALVLCVCQIVYSVAEYKKAEDKRKELEDLMSAIGSTSATETLTATVTDLTETTEATEPDVTDATTTETVEVTEPVPVPREQYRAIYEQISTLKAQYPDLFGWIYIEFDEKHIINLPVMQGDDNSFYIHHAYDGSESKAGSITVDYRNTDYRIDLNQNIILYGHHMNDGSMFANVASKYKSQENFNSVPVVFYSTEGVYTFNVFAVYNAKDGDDYDTIGFGGDRLKQFCLEKQRKSFYTKNLTFDEQNTIITLVTCTNFGSEGRVIVHGVLDGYDSFFD